MWLTAEYSFRYKHFVVYHSNISSKKCKSYTWLFIVTCTELFMYVKGVWYIVPYHESLVIILSPVFVIMTTDAHCGCSEE